MNNTPLTSLYKNRFESNFCSEIFNFEEQTINKFSEGFYGFNALFLGLPLAQIRNNIISQSWFIDNRYTKYINSADQNNEKINPLSLTNPKNLAIDLSLVDLPFQNRALDLIIANHVLDTSEEPESICREFARVLSSEGMVIITMFNPNSLIGYTKNTRSIKDELSNSWRKLTARRLREWLLVLGLEVEQAKFGVYTPTSKITFFSESCSNKIINNLNFIGDRWFASMGAVYVLVARRRTFRSTMVGAHKKAKVRYNKPVVATATSSKLNNRVK